MIPFHPIEILQNMTIEERVSLLELQVESVDEEFDFLFDETVNQDERLFSLKQETEEIEDDIVSKFLNTYQHPYYTSHFFKTLISYEQ